MPPANTAPQAPSRSENLALIFQELFTAIERLRSNRQEVSDSDSFRHHIREAVKTAAQEAHNRAGYSTEDIRKATLAVVGFLDETILNLQSPSIRQLAAPAIAGGVVRHAYGGRGFLSESAGASGP